ALARIRLGVLADALDFPFAVIDDVVMRSAGHCGLPDCRAPASNAGIRPVCGINATAILAVPRLRGFAHLCCELLWTPVNSVQQEAMISLILGQFSRPWRFISSRYLSFSQRTMAAWKLGRALIRRYQSAVRGVGSSRPITSRCWSRTT